MNKMHFLFFAAVLFIAGCQSNLKETFVPTDSNIRYAGRIDYSDPNEPKLVGSGSFIECRFKGKNCEVLLKKLNPNGEYNFVSIELDGQYVERLKIMTDTLAPYVINAAIEGAHLLRIYKATEASNNQIAFGGINSSGLLPLESLPTRKIEFIGNSITCAMGADLSDLPCGEGLWYDQHNAYFSYGTQSAKRLDAQFVLSSVSGMGMYRNWNSLSPVMPDVYENLYLNTDSTQRYDFAGFVPDMVSICLGTNDMSLGDGKSERLPFDSATYVQTYVDFIGLVYQKYPDTQICLLSSPMMGQGEGRTLLGNCLAAIKDMANEQYSEKKPIAFFDLYINTPPSGCTSHPSKEDHELMTDRLVPFYKEVMGW